MSAAAPLADYSRDICQWMFRRLRAAETQAWQYQPDDKYRDPPKYRLGQPGTCHSTTFSKLQYRLDATRSLDALQKPRRPTPTGAPRPQPRSQPASAWGTLRFVSLARASTVPPFHVAHTGSRAHRAIVSGGAREYDLSESDSKSLALSCSQREYSRE